MKDTRRQGLLGAICADPGRKLAALGFTDVYELQGGMVAWEEAKLPVSRKRSKN